MFSRKNESILTTLDSAACCLGLDTNSDAKICSPFSSYPTTLLTPLLTPKNADGLYSSP